MTLLYASSKKWAQHRNPVPAASEKEEEEMRGRYETERTRDRRKAERYRVRDIRGTKRLGRQRNRNAERQDYRDAEK
jgi:hypothetical protein